MNKKPDPKDFPPESPHDLEWGGYNHEKYSQALRIWEANRPISIAEMITRKPSLIHVSLPKEQIDASKLLWKDLVEYHYDCCFMGTKKATAKELLNIITKYKITKK